MPPSYFSGYKGGYACSLQHRGAVRPKDVPPQKKTKRVCSRRGLRASSQGVVIEFEAVWGTHGRLA